MLGIDDKSGIHACKLPGVAFQTAIGVLLLEELEEQEDDLQGQPALRKAR